LTTTSNNCHFRVFSVLLKNNGKNNDISMKCHPREGGDPVFIATSRIPAFAGMTEAMIITSNY